MPFRNRANRLEYARRKKAAWRRRYYRRKRLSRKYFNKWRMKAKISSDMRKILPYYGYKKGRTLYGKVSKLENKVKKIARVSDGLEVQKHTFNVNLPNLIDATQGGTHTGFIHVPVVNPAGQIAKDWQVIDFGLDFTNSVESITVDHFVRKKYMDLSTPYGVEPVARIEGAAYHRKYTRIDFEVLIEQQQAIERDAFITFYLMKAKHDMTAMRPGIEMPTVCSWFQPPDAHSTFNRAYRHKWLVDAFGIRPSSLVTGNRFTDQKEHWQIVDKHTISLREKSVNDSLIQVDNGGYSEINNTLNAPRTHHVRLQYRYKNDGKCNLKFTQDVSDAGGQSPDPNIMDMIYKGDLIVVAFFTNGAVDGTQPYINNLSGGTSLVPQPYTSHQQVYMEWYK